MVVDDIKQHTESCGMGGIDEGVEIPGRAVAAGRGKEGNTVVSPVPATRKICDWHEFDGIDAQVDQILQSIDHCPVGSLGREGPHVQLVDHETVAGQSSPVAVAPLEDAGIDNLGWAVNAFGLKPAAGIRQRWTAVDPK